MSTASPMPTWQRVENYAAHGRSSLTPAQARRIKHKAGRAAKREILDRVAQHIREGL